MKLLANLAVAVVAMIVLPACGADVGDIYQPAEWRALFKKHGWTALLFPESKYRPGAIIKVTEAGGIRYIDDLRSCGYPPEVLDPEVGKIPALTFDKARELGAKAVLNIRGISAGPEFSNVAKARLNITDHSADALRLIKLRIWQETPGNLDGAARFCVEALEKPDYYLVTEAFRVSKGRYTLFSKTGAKLKLSLANLGKLLALEPDVKYQVTAEGALEIDEPVTFAVRRAISTTAGFEVLGAGAVEPPTADALIDKVFEKETDQ